MAFGMDKITAKLEDKFEKLYAILVEIRDELRTQRGAPR